MMTGICVELTKYLQDLKGERKTVSGEKVPAMGRKLNGRIEGHV